MNETYKKIQKKIAMLANYNNEIVKELFITEEEFSKLNGISIIDGVKLKVKPSKKAINTTDCFAFIENSNSCYALKKLYCKNKQHCKFYKSKNEYSIAQAEKEIRKYSNE